MDLVGFFDEIWVGEHDAIHRVATGFLVRFTRPELRNAATPKGGTVARASIGIYGISGI